MGVHRTTPLVAGRVGGRPASHQDHAENDGECEENDRCTTDPHACPSGARRTVEQRGALHARRLQRDVIPAYHKCPGIFGIHSERNSERRSFVYRFCSWLLQWRVVM